MSAPKKSRAAAELDHFEDALVDSILAADDTELQDDIVASGGKSDTVLDDFDSMLVAAKAACATRRLREAQEQVTAFHASLISMDDDARTASRARFDAQRARDRQFSSKMMVAARKGQGATPRDLDSLADDYAELERLEQSAGENDSDPG